MDCLAANKFKRWQMYSVPQDIQDEFAAITFSTESKVTTTQLSEWILKRVITSMASSAVGTSRLSLRRLPEAFSILKRICIFRVSERVKNKLEVKSNATQTDSEQKYIQNYVRTPNQDLEAIARATSSWKMFRWWTHRVRFRVHAVRRATSIPATPLTWIKINGDIQSLQRGIRQLH